MMALYVHLSYNGTIYTLYVTYNATMVIMMENHIVKLSVFPQIELKGQDGLRPCLMNLGVLKIEKR